MTLIIWQNDYSVGHPRLDADHIVVASLINHIDEAKRVGSDEGVVGTLLKVLLDHARAHFDREEQLLDACSYPDLARHRQEHQLVRDQLDEIHKAYSCTPDPALSQEIMEILNFWLIEHIMKADMRYKAYVRTSDQ